MATKFSVLIFIAVGSGEGPLADQGGRFLRVMEIGPMDLFKRIKLHLLWHREAARIRNELSTYSPRELQQDLGINPSDIGDVAARGADAFVASYVRAHPDYRQAFYGFGNAADLPA